MCKTVDPCLSEPVAPGQYAKAAALLFLTLCLFLTVHGIPAIPAHEGSRSRYRMRSFGEERLCDRRFAVCFLHAIICRHGRPGSEDHYSAYHIDFSFRRTGEKWKSYPPSSCRDQYQRWIGTALYQDGSRILEMRRKSSCPLHVCIR